TDRGPAGKIKLDGHRLGWLEVDGAYSGPDATHTKGDRLAPPAGAKEVPFRVCDYYAFSPSKIKGFPRCGLYWPVAERDRAARACAAFLTKYGAQFKFSSLHQSLRRPSWPGDDRAHLTFPRRDRPATAEVVRDGQAIFAFAKEDKVRAWKMP